MNLAKFDGVTLAKEQVTALINDSIAKAMEKGSLPQEEIRPFVVEIPQDLRNGDYSSNVAMVNSKVFRSNPRAIQQQFWKIWTSQALSLKRQNLQVLALSTSSSARNTLQQL